MKKILSLGLLGIAALSACSDDDSKEDMSPAQETSTIDLKAHSTTANYLKLDPAFSNVAVYPILSSEDQLDESKAFVYGSMADGAGLLKNNDGTLHHVSFETNG